MSKISRRLRKITDYYISPQRLVRVITEVTDQLALREGWQIAREGYSCILFDPVSGTAFELVWPNCMSHVTSVTVHCGIFDALGSKTESLPVAEVHQEGDRFKRRQWVWLPRIADDGPTSYELKYLLSQRRYKWKKTRVGRGTDTPFSDGMSKPELVDDLVRIFKNDFDKYSRMLRALIT